jgi:signal transduction histidine kinase
MSALVAGAVLTGAALTLLFVNWRGRMRLLQERLDELSKPLHELRGALTALDLGLAALVRSAAVRNGVDDCVEALRVSLERATLGARDIEALRQGHRPTSMMNEIDFTSLLARSAKAWARLARTRGVELAFDWRAGPVRVNGDARRLAQALDNLLANALEHGGGRIAIEGELRGRRVRVSISDGGPGPSVPLEEDRARAARSYHGHGLAIAGQVIREHRGALGLGAGVNGAALVFELPLARVAGTRVEPARTPISRAA